MTLKPKMLKLLKFKPAAAIICILAFWGACVHRTLTIRTPEKSPACQVYLDGEYAGDTPYTEEFVFYGTREVMLKGPDGELTVIDVPLRRPWHQYFPVDFFSEILYPGTAEHSIEVTLLPAEKETPDLDALRKRADAYRTEFRRKADADK